MDLHVSVKTKATSKGHEFHHERILYFLFLFIKIFESHLIKHDIGETLLAFDFWP